MYFPITIIDNFYSNFNKVLSLVNNTKFISKKNVYMPGLSSDHLNNLDTNINEECVMKIIRNYYSRRTYTGYNYVTWFDKITPYNNQHVTEGWIHYDDDNKLTGILFICGEVNEGLSFYEKNDNYEHQNFFDIKKQLYLGENVDNALYNKKIKEHNANFNKILDVSFRPNRLVLFDSSIYHAANGMGSVNKPRIIQPIFFQKIIADYFPIPEMNRI